MHYFDINLAQFCFKIILFRLLVSQFMKLSPCLKWLITLV